MKADKTAVTGGLFFVPSLPNEVGKLTATTALQRHLQARRLKAGALVQLCDGAGQACVAELQELQTARPRVFELAWAAPLDVPPAPTPTVHLLFGQMESTRLEWLLEKATELGAASLTPLVLQRTQGRLEPSRQEAKLARWRAIVLAAAEQSENFHPPVVHAPLAWADWCAAVQTESASTSATVPQQHWLLLDPQAPDSLATWLQQHRPTRSIQSTWPTRPPPEVFHLLSGCEGGFAPHEIDDAKRLGLTRVHLGARVLRAETAPMAALAWLMLVSPVVCG